MALPQRRDPNEERRIEDAERRRIVTEPGGGGFGWWWLWLLIIIAIIWFAGWGWGGYGGWWWGRRGVAPVTNNANVSPTGVNANGANGANNGAAAAVPTGEGVAILNATNKREFIGQRVDIRDVRVGNKINDRALWIGNTNNGNNGANSGNNGAGAGAGVNGTNGAGANANATTGPGGLGANAGTSGNNGGAANAGGANAKPGAERAAMAEVPTLVVLTGAANTANNKGGGNASNGGGNGGNNANQTANTAVNGNLNNVKSGELVNVIGTVEKAPAANVAEKEWGLSNQAARQLERDGAYIRATEIMTAGPGNGNQQ